MIRRVKILAAAITLVAVAGILNAASAQDLGLPVGSKAPVVTVHGLDGKAVDLSRYIGKTPLLIEFWATWCANCRELMPAMSAAEKKFGKRVKFLTLAVAINQSPERVRRYVAAHRMPYEMLYDTDGKAAAAFDAPATSYVVVIDKAGKIVYTGVGGKQNLESAVAKAL